MNGVALCRVGLHKWRKHRRMGVCYFWGLPLRGLLWTGEESCARCGKRVRDRKDWIEWSTDIAWGVLTAAFLAFIALGVVVTVRIAWPDFVRFVRFALTGDAA